MTTKCSKIFVVSFWATCECKIFQCCISNYFGSTKSQYLITYFKISSYFTKHFVESTKLAWILAQPSTSSKYFNVFELFRSGGGDRNILRNICKKIVVIIFLEIWLELVCSVVESSGIHHDVKKQFSPELFFWSHLRTRVAASRHPRGTRAVRRERYRAPSGHAKRPGDLRMNRHAAVCPAVYLTF